MYCPGCNSKAKLVDSRVIYGRSYGNAWVCSSYPTCDHYVGCHKGTEKALGTLANKETREFRIKAHALFDPLWRGKGNGVRTLQYRRLADYLDIKVKDCHISMFNVSTCRRVMQFCKLNSLIVLLK